MHLLEIDTGSEIPCEIEEVINSDFKFIQANFSFDWKKESSNYEVYKLVTSDHKVHGLISIKQDEGFLLLNLIELAKTNLGAERKFARAAGNMIAFAASVALENYDGWMLCIAKTALINHYSRSYGFKQLGNSNRMISDHDNSENLVTSYL